MSSLLPARALAQTPAESDTIGFQWHSALVQSGLFLGIQHAYRIYAESDTRQGLRGPFLRDYFHSVRSLHGWSDGDHGVTNYVGHPMMGAVTGFIYVQNQPFAATRKFGFNRGYWNSRLHAMGWSAAYSTLFELGPASEASLGNIGLNPKKQGFVDMVVTPTVGTSFLVVEDILDRYVVSAVERRTNNKVLVAITRALLNPDRSIANLLRKQQPWSRDTRPGLIPPAGGPLWAHH